MQYERIRKNEERDQHSGREKIGSLERALRKQTKKEKADFCCLDRKRTNNSVCTLVNVILAVRTEGNTRI